MKLSEIKNGMEGEGRTIFKGTAIESFTFKVLGILTHIYPNKSLIIVELKSPILEENGVMAGMSGSPLYINSKLIGAVSYSLTNFAKKPIAGVTPIEDILETSQYNNPTISISISDIQVDFDEESILAIKEKLQQALAKRINASANDSLSPIKLLATHKGILPVALSYLTPVFGNGYDLPLNSQANKTTLKTTDLFQISPADAIAIPLVRGDFEYSASGTVTHIDKNNIYIFGHPFFNLGTVSFPLHKAEVISVIPSMESSFKLSSTQHMIGRVVQDRLSAVQGVLGEKPYMIPVKIFLKNRNKKFDLEMVDHPLLTPALSNISLLNIFYSEYQQYGFQSFEVTGKIFIENERNVIIEDLYSGASSFDEFANLILAINFYLMNNKDKNIKIQKMDFELNGSGLMRNTNLEDVEVNKISYKANEIMDITIHLQNERGSRLTKTINIPAPALKHNSIFYLMVGDKDEMNKFDAKNVNTSYFPVKLNSLIRIINNLRKNNSIYMKLFTPSQGLFIKGYEYSNIPQSMQQLFNYHTTSESKVEMKLSTLREYQVEIPAVFKGLKIFKLQIQE